MTEFAYTHFFNAGRRYKWVIPVSILLALVFAFLWMNVTTPKYTGEMILGPTSQTGVAARGIRLPIENLQNEKIRANPTEINNNETLSDFAREVQLLTSPEVAEQLLADQDLAIAERLLSQRGMMIQIKSVLWKMAGQKTNTQKDASTLAAALESQLHIDAIGLSAMRRITFRHADREFAIDLLNALYRAADKYLRNQAQERTVTETAYLRAALDRVTLADQRKALLDLLVEQEQTQLLLAVDLPFAADQVQRASAPHRPDWPPVGLVLFFAICIGAFAGFSILYMLAVREWKKI